MKGTVTTSTSHRNCQWLMLLAVLIIFPHVLSSQVVPDPGEIQCFFVGNDGVFTDPGGLGGSDTEGAPGNYPNCNCVTTTTLCAPDGSAVSVDMTSFGVFASFDWLVILDADNAAAEEFPFSILTNPSNVDLQLFNNADGNGDGGSENYGPGANIGAQDLPDLPSTTFTASNVTGCLTFVFRASGTVDDPGWDALISTSSTITHPGDDVPCGDVDCLPPFNVQVTDITFESGLITWEASPDSDDYVLEFGPAGFAPGTGTVVNVNGTSYLLTGLNENTGYDVYLRTDCDGEFSALVGPFNFTTPFINPPVVCTYSLELFDSFGDGWNGAQLTVTVGGVSTNYTVPPGGEEAFFNFQVFNGLPLTIEYSSGTFENEVTYNVLDSDGNIFLSDGPFPQVGLVFDGVGDCPACPAVSAAFVDTLFVGIDSAVVTWIGNGAADSYIIEYGPSGFPVGAGLTITTDNPPVSLTGLNSCVTYDVYITAECGPDTLSSAAGPLTFTTDTDAQQGDPCNYTLNLFDSFGDGWNGAFLSVTVNGVTTDYTIPIGGSFATFTIQAFQNSVITLNYTEGTFPFEVTYQLIDPDGNVVFSDGPAPQQGFVTSIIACPTCAGPTQFNTIDVNADNAIVGFNEADSSGTYILEYGPLGFTLGTGTVLNPTDTEVLITGLQEATWYNVYLGYECDNGDRIKNLAPLTFRTKYFNDVGISGLAAPTVEDCNLGPNETIEVVMQNFGQNPQSLVPFFYAVNGVPAGIPFPTDGFFTGVIGNDSLETIAFETTFDLSAPGTYLIEAWTELEDDSDITNDTFRTIVQTAQALPLVEDFESGVFQEDWDTDEAFPIYFPFAHNNPTTIIADNLTTFDNSFQVTTPRVGPLGDAETLTFDYRFVDFFAGTIATQLGDDRLDVQISTDCGDTFETIFTIDSTNHVPNTTFTNIEVDLSAYEGEGINVRFLGTYGGGGNSYWLDLDNINVTGCPVSFLLQEFIADATPPSGTNGAISLEPLVGTGPFEYQWSNAQVGSSISGLEPGDYTVTVTDASGCTEEATFTVGLGTGIDEPDLNAAVKLFPNPTNGATVLSLQLNRAEDVRIDLFNSTGQLLSTIEQDGVRELQEELELYDQPSGMYLVRVQAAGETYLKKLILQK